MAVSGVVADIALLAFVILASVGYALVRSTVTVREKQMFGFAFGLYCLFDLLSELCADTTLCQAYQVRTAAGSDMASARPYGSTLSNATFVLWGGGAAGAANHQVLDHLWRRGCDQHQSALAIDRRQQPAPADDEPAATAAHPGADAPALVRPPTTTASITTAKDI